MGPPSGPRARQESSKPESQESRKECVFVSLWPCAPSGKPAPPFSGVGFEQGSPPVLLVGLTGLSSSTRPAATEWFRDWTQAWSRDSGKENRLSGVLSCLPLAGRDDHHLPADPCPGTRMRSPKPRTGNTLARGQGQKLRFGDIIY